MSVEVKEKFQLTTVEEDKIQKFIHYCLTQPPAEPVEDAGAVVHETNRIPDPRILLVENGEILRLDGKKVDDSIEKESYLGRVEYAGFLEIKKWAKENDRGFEAWFSPSYLPNYPTCKIDMGEIYHANDGTKVLLKRAVLVDVDNETFLKIANNVLRRCFHAEISSVEALRATPIFGDRKILFEILDEISKYTNQVETIEDELDLDKKIETYETLSSIDNEIVQISSVSNEARYWHIRQTAQERGMIGDKSESCPTGKTAFESFSGSSRESSKTLKCTCPFCHKKVTAIIANGRIFCPECNKSAPYVC